MSPDQYNDMGNGIPYITGASNIKKGRIIINRWTEYGKARAYRGDLLLTCKGTVGAMTILNEVEVHIGRQIMAIRPDAGISIAFIQLVLETYVTELKTAAKSMIPGISRESVLQLLFPLAPRPEQDCIVSKVKEMMPYVQQYGDYEQSLNWLNVSFPNQLKKSILQCAVQGKLVSQNPEDEPASVLLKRIKEEKNKLVKEGTIKKEKHESRIFRRDNSHYEKLDGIESCINDEIPFDIPDSWCWARLGTLVGIQRGASPRPKGSPEYWSYERTIHHWIKISDISKYSVGNILFDTDEFLTDLGATKSVFVDEDYLITAASGSLGKIAKLGITGYIYDGLMCLCFKGISLEKEYILILIQTMIDYLLSVSTGTAWKNITTEILKNLLVPLPPLSEQKRIIEKSKELIKLSNSI